MARLCTDLCRRVCASLLPAPAPDQQALVRIVAAFSLGFFQDEHKGGRAKKSKGNADGAVMRRSLAVLRCRSRHWCLRKSAEPCSRCIVVYGQALSFTHPP